MMRSDRNAGAAPCVPLDTYPWHARQQSRRPRSPRHFHREMRSALFMPAIPKLRATTLHRITDAPSTGLFIPFQWTLSTDFAHGVHSVHD